MLTAAPEGGRGGGKADGLGLEEKRPTQLSEHEKHELAAWLLWGDYEAIPSREPVTG